jgi:hypothetical protein
MAPTPAAANTPIASRRETVFIIGPFAKTPKYLMKLSLPMSVMGSKLSWNGTRRALQNRELPTAGSGVATTIIACVNDKLKIIVMLVKVSLYRQRPTVTDFAIASMACY